MKKLSFFTRLSSKGEITGSSRIRGYQVATYLGAKINPIENYNDDVCIYVKKQPPENFPKYSYLDLVDGHRRVPWLEKHPHIGVIASSQSAYEYLAKKLGRNDIVLIPQHHCNFDRVRRKRKSVTVAGVIGRPTAIRYPWDKLRKKLNKLGMELKIQNKYTCKEDVVNFYKGLDVQIVWRVSHRWYKNSLKIVNAGSFGIPTVAWPEIGYKDMEGCYLPAETIDNLISGVSRLKNSQRFYQGYAEKLIKKTEQYHIKNIAKLYIKLLKKQNG
jgi:hypothetical protein